MLVLGCRTRVLVCREVFSRRRTSVCCARVAAVHGCGIGRRCAYSGVGNCSSCRRLGLHRSFLRWSGLLSSAGASLVRGCLWWLLCCFRRGLGWPLCSAVVLVLSSSSSPLLRLLCLFLAGLFFGWLSLLIAPFILCVPDAIGIFVFRRRCDYYGDLGLGWCRSSAIQCFFCSFLWISWRGDLFLLGISTPACT